MPLSEADNKQNERRGLISEQSQSYDTEPTQVEADRKAKNTQNVKNQLISELTKSNDVDISSSDESDENISLSEADNTQNAQNPLISEPEL